MAIDSNGLFRIDAKLPLDRMRTYQLRSPLTTHWRNALCQDVDCDAYANGWQTTLDLSTELGVEQAKYIRFKSGRHFTVEEHLPLVTLTFPPGQQCFRPHYVPLEREPTLIVRDGDWRGNPTGYRRVHTRVEDWIDDFANNQISVAEGIENG